MPKFGSRGVVLSPGATMGVARRVASALALVIIIVVTTAHCGGGAGTPPAGNPDAGSGSGGGPPDGSIGSSDAGGGGSTDAGGGGSVDAGGGGSGDAGSGGGGTGGGDGDAGTGSAACSQPGLAAADARTYVIDPAGREPEYSAADESGTMLFGVTSPGGPITANEAPLVSPEGTTKAYLSFARGARLHSGASGFSGVLGSFSGNFSVDQVDDDGRRTAGPGYVAAGRIVDVADPRSGTLLLGTFRRAGEAESAASRRAVMVSGTKPPAELWSAPLASNGAVFGAGLDLFGNALVVTDGTGRFGSGAISAQWISSTGADLTGEFLLVSGFEPGSNTWFEVSALGKGGVAVRRVDATDFTGKDLRSRYLCVVDSGAKTCASPPDWLASRPNVRIEAIRNGNAYAVLPDPATVTQCEQTVELLDLRGASCGSVSLPMAAGSCRTRALSVGKDGTLIQPLANEAWHCDAARGCRATWRWLPGLFH